MIIAVPKKSPNVHFSLFTPLPYPSQYKPRVSWHSKPWTFSKPVNNITSNILKEQIPTFLHHQLQLHFYYLLPLSNTIYPVIHHTYSTIMVKSFFFYSPFPIAPPLTDFSVVWPIISFERDIPVSLGVFSVNILVILWRYGSVSPKYLYRLSGPLSHPLVFQPFRKLFPFFLGSLPFPWQFFPPFGHYFDHLVCLSQTSLPTFTSNISFTGFPALRSILRLLPTSTFPPLANLFNFLANFFSLFNQPVFSTYFFSQFCDQFFKAVNQFSHNSLPNFMPTAFPTGFPAIYQIFPLFSSFTSPTLTIFYIIVHIFSVISLVSLKHLSQPVQSFSQLRLCYRPNKQKKCVNPHCSDSEIFSPTPNHRTLPKELQNRHSHSWHYSRTPFLFSFNFRPTFIPFTNTYLLFTSYLRHQSCTFFYILLQIYSCLSYHTCIADCCVSPWRYNTKWEQQHRSPIGSLLNNRFPIMSHSVKACISYWLSHNN